MDRERMMKTMREAISNVLGTMFFQLVHIHDNNYNLQAWFPETQLLYGANLRFSGPLRGSFYLFIPPAMIAEITANFLGIEEKEVDEKQKTDTIKEALNMIAGNTLARFDKEGTLRLGIPELIAEEDCTEDKLEGLTKDIILIETEENRLAAGIEFD